MTLRQLLPLALILVSACGTTIGTRPIQLANQIQTRLDHEMLGRDYIVPPQGEQLAPYLPRMERLITKSGLTLKPMTDWPLVDEIRVWGYYEKTTRVIYIDRTMPPSAVVAVEVHEFAHHIQPMPLSGDGQVFAEAVSFLVCKELGLDLGENSMSYIAGFPFAKPLQLYSVQIDKAVEMIVRELKTGG